MKSTQKGTFNVQVFLDSPGIAKRIVAYRRAEVISAPKGIPVRASCTSKRAV
jgi:hypothetical protein